MPALACPECGARLDPNDAICPLCGADVADPKPTPEPDTPTVAGTDPIVASAPVGSSEVLCPSCGTRNPAGARFCLNCGTALSGATGRPAPAPSAKRRPGLIAAGVGALAVLALFGIDRMGQDDAPAPAVSVSGGEAVQQAPVAAEEPALSPEAAARAGALRADIAAVEPSSPDALAKRIELVQVLAENGRLVDAAEVQAGLAEITGTASAWANAGSLLFDRMLNIPESDRAPLAVRAADYYERSLAIEDDPDVRANRAWALQYGDNPMQAVLEMRAVVDAYPDHGVANYNFGLMQLRIGRTEKAIEYFQKAVASTDHDDPVHQRAEQELERLRSTTPG
jgi:hypothetical protein